MNFEATSIPYSPDVLIPHDRNLVWAREFGTDTTDDRGDDYDAGAVGSIDSAIDARLAMLGLASKDAGTTTNALRGRTWLLPPWPTPTLWPYPGQLLSGRVIFAHLQQPELPVQQPAAAGDNLRSMLAVGPAGLVGLAPAIPCVATGIVETAPFSPVATATIAESIAEEYQAGGDQPPTLQTVGGQWGPDVWIRMVLLTDTLSFTVILSWIGTGLCWVPFQPQANCGWVAQRVGLVQRGLGTSRLDWIRCYTMDPMTQDHAFQFPEPPLPLTGGRIFTP